VRTGLLAVGAAMAIVGAGVVFAVTMPLVPAPASKTDRSWDVSLTADSWQSHDLVAASAGTASVTFNWNASKAADVDWYAIEPCSNSTPLVRIAGQSWCIQGQALDKWTNLSSGNWTARGPPSIGYCVLVDNSGAAPVSFTAEFQESYHASGKRLPLVPMVLVVAGGSLLAAIGGIAAYLGAFLPAGVYRDDEMVDGPLDPDEPDPPVE
jgi:hypothetical protein